MTANLEMIETVIKGTATVIIPLAGIWIANKLSRSVRERELRTKYIEIAVDILKDKPTEQRAALRQWASDVITRYSEIKLPTTAQNNLVRDAPLTTERSSEEKLFEMQRNFYAGKYEKK